MKSPLIGVFLVMIAAGCKEPSEKPAPNPQSSGPGANTSEPRTGASSAIKDPEGRYALFSDPRIKKAPAAGLTIGNGQLFTVEYASGTDVVFYEVFFVDRDGVVRSATRGPLVSTDQMIHSSDIMVFDSAADGRPGFVALHTVGTTKVDDDGKMSGSPVRLGMYAVSIETKK
ncbi:MAG: hypothetical protein H0X17_05215 [Deltaproteobacteria bacterium]|nr:hypothetical protein [Deltaproteobacteria bacterium]